MSGHIIFLTQRNPLLGNDTSRWVQCSLAVAHLFPEDFSQCPNSHSQAVGSFRGQEHEDRGLIPLSSSPATHDISLSPRRTITVDISVNKFTAGPCRQQFLTRTNTPVLATLLVEDHGQQTSHSFCPQLAAVCPQL